MSILVAGGGNGAPQPKRKPVLCPRAWTNFDASPAPRNANGQPCHQAARVHILIWSRVAGSPSW
jgi:hypothetical protein